MNEAHWHLLTNHLPIIGTYFSTIVLIGGIITRNRSIVKTSFLLFGLTALLAIPALITGDGAEDVLESIGQKNEHFIHRHEELAEKVFWLTEFIGVTCIFLAFFQSDNIRLIKMTTMFVLILTIINSILLTYVGNTGGEIRHSEIRDIGDVNNSAGNN